MDSPHVWSNDYQCACTYAGSGRKYTGIYVHCVYHETMDIRLLSQEAMMCVCY